MNNADTLQYKKMTETPIPKLVAALGIPTTISMLVTNIYNMADTYFVGEIGTSASGAVGVVFGLMAILQAVGFMFGHGAGSIVSRKLGEKDGEYATKIASTSFFAALISGIVITVLGFIFLTPLMRVLGSTDTILPYAKAYASYILLAAPFMVSSCVLNNILRYEGRAFMAMIGLTAGGILNIFGDYVLMRVFDMGVTGAGIATGISQVTSFLILLFMFLSGRTQCKIGLKKISGNIQDLFKICKTGLPSLMRQGLSSIATMVLNGYAGLWGDAAVAAMTIANRISFFIFAVALGIGQGFQPVSAFNYGAKKYGRVRSAFYFTVLAGEILLGIFSVAGMFLSPYLVGIFRDDPKVIEIGTVALKAQLISLFFHPLVVCANMMFQSVGKNSVATFLSMLRSALCFIPTIIVLTHFWGIKGVQLSQTVADIIAFFISLPFALRFLNKLNKMDKEEENYNL